MTFNFTSWWSTTEADVIAIIAKVKADTVVAESDVHKALTWLADETPTIVAGLQTALGIAEAVGVVTAPELVAANAAVAALNAFAQAQANAKTSGNTNLMSDAKSVVTGYVAYTQANAAVNAAKATAAQAALPSN